jgi:hypothetical protein
LTFDNAGRSESFTNFPVLVTLNNTFFDYSNTKSDGSDLRFIDADGSTLLNYHIEEWDSSGESYIWVNVTGIDADSQTDYMTMYYGYSTASDVQDITGTYDSNFSAVWHLNETSGTHYDATSNNNDGTQQNGVTQDSQGTIDGADFFDGTSQEYVTASDDSSLNPSGDITVGAWVKFDDLSSTSGYRQNILFKLDTGDAPWWDYSLYLDTNDFLYFGWTTSGGTSKWSWYTGSLSADTWYHVVGQRDGSTMRFYVNGATTDTGGDTGATGSINDGTGGIRLGSEWEKYYLNGSLDEVRISDSARSAQWIDAQYDTMMDNFLIYGDEDGYSDNVGAAYIFFGYPGISLSNINATSANVTITGETAGDLFGWSVSDLGNVDSDTKDDIIIGAPGWDDTTIDNIWSSSDEEVNQDSGTGLTLLFVQMDADPDGNVIMVWHDDRNGDWDIYAQKFDPDGNPLWGYTDLKVNQNSDSASQRYPSMDVDANGNTVVVWRDERDTDQNIYAQKLDPNGLPLWNSTDVRINQNTDGLNQFEPAVDCGSNGMVTIVWHDERDGILEGDIYAQQLNSTGWIQWGATDKKVNQNTGTNIQKWPRVEMDSSGYAIIVWEDERVSASNENIYAQKLNSAGTAQWGSSDVLVNQNSDSSPQYRPKMDMDSNEDVIIVWYDERSGATNTTIYAQKINDTGVAQWGSSDKKISQNFDSAYRRYPDVSVDANDHAVVVWEDERNGASDDDIYAQKINTLGNPLWGSSDVQVNQNSDSQIQAYPEVAVTSDGNAVGAWVDYRSGSSWELYCQKLGMGDTGRAYVFYGRSSWSSSYNADSADVTITGENVGNRFGQSVSGAGDVDGSDYNDIIVGAPGYSSDTGRAYIFYGDGSIPTSAGSADKTLTGEATGDQFGFVVSNAGDVDNNGKDDCIVGAPYNDDAGTDAGKAYVYYFSESYAYADTNSVTYGMITNFTDMKSASDSGAYAILKEELVPDYASGTSEITIDDAVDDATDEYNPSPGAVFINETDGYVFFIDDAAGSNNRQVSYRKSTDGGVSWGSEVSISTDLDFHNVAVWYDQWTPGLTGTKIHVVAVGDDNDEVVYRWLDTNDDALRSSWVTVGDMGAFMPPDGGVSITNSTDGNLFALGFGTSPGVFKSTDNGSTWNDITPGYYFDDVNDHAQLLPLSDGDILCIYHDASTYWARSFVYDEGTDTWPGSATGIEIWYASADANWGAVVDKSTGDIYLAADERPDTADYDLKTYIFSDSSRTWTAKTDIITTSATACKDVKLMINEDNQDVFAVYIKGGASANVYYKKSTDGMTTWGSETQISTTVDDHIYVKTNFMSNDLVYAFWFNDDLEDLHGCIIANITDIYKMNIQINTTGVDSGDSYELELNYSTDGSETDFGILVYDTGGSWDDLGSQGDLTSTTFTTKTYTLENTHRDGSGLVLVRFLGRNETSDTVNSTLNIEYLRIKSTSESVKLLGENSSHLFGWSVGNVSDINEDGSYDDIIVGAPMYRDAYNYTWGASDTRVHQNIGYYQQRSPEMVVDSSGNTIVVWWDDRTGANTAIYAQKLNSTGDPQWGADDLLVNGTLSGDHEEPDIAIDSDDNVVIVWFDRNSLDLYAQKLDSDGNALWDSGCIRVNQNTTSWQVDPKVAMDSNGDAIFVWQDGRVATSDYDIYAQKLNGTGVAKWGANDTRVNQNTDGLQQWEPAIALDSNDFAYVVWGDERAGTTDDDIYAQKLNTSGTVLWGSSDRKVNQNTDSARQQGADVIVDVNDYAYVVWADERAGINDEEIYGQKLSGGGFPLWGSTDKQISQGSGEASWPSIATHTDGMLFVSFTDDRKGGLDNRIFAQKLDSEGNTYWGSSDMQFSHEGATDSAWGSDVDVDSNGNVIVVFQDNRDTGLNNYSVYANKYVEGNVTGKAYIYHGGSTLDSTSDVNLTGENDGDKFGYSVHSAGDIDGDGKPDVIIGAPYWDDGATTDCGQILVFKGGSSMDTTADFVHNGTQANEHFGWSVGFAGKMDLGANSMVVVGSPHKDGSTDTGEAEVLYIPEYSSIIIPVVGIIIFFSISKRNKKKKQKYKKHQNEPPSQINKGGC